MAAAMAIAWPGPAGSILFSTCVDPHDQHDAGSSVVPRTSHAEQ